MAKGDKNKIQNQTDYTKNLGNNQENNLLNDTIIPSTQQAQNNTTIADQLSLDRSNDIYNQLNSFAPTPYVPINYNPISVQTTPEFNSALSGYQNFADTGGFSQDDINDLRARAISPIRAVYGDINNELIRQRALQGGYSPNFGAVSAKLAREGSQQIDDAVTNANAQLAQMVQQGKEFGLGGLGSLSEYNTGLINQIALQNEANRLNVANLNNQGNQQNNANTLAKLGAMTQLYSASPGLANSFANQFQGDVGNWLNAQGQINNINQNAISNQGLVAQTPSNFQTGLGYLGNIANIGASLISPFSGFSASNVIPSSNPYNYYGTPGSVSYNL